MANGYRRPVCRSTVHRPTSRRIVEIQLTEDDYDGHRNIVDNRTNRRRRYARTNCARRRTFGPIYTTTHEDSSSGGGGARDCRCWCRRRRYPSWNGSKSQVGCHCLLSVPNQSTIDAGVVPGSRTDVVRYGRLNRRSKLSTTDAVRCGAVRCNEPEGREVCTDSVM